MAGRPRTVANEDILAGTARAISRVGPARLTLADVAAETGLAPATLMQRFGSKRDLLLAFAAHASENAQQGSERSRGKQGSPLEALLGGPLGAMPSISSPDELANHLAFLQLELADPDFHQHTVAHARATRAEIRRLLGAAVEAGEIIPCDTARLAETLQVTYNGALITWAILRHGRLANWLRRQLGFVLDPYRA